MERGYEDRKSPFSKLGNISLRDKFSGIAPSRAESWGGFGSKGSRGSEARRGSAPAGFAKWSPKKGFSFRREEVCVKRNPDGTVDFDDTIQGEGRSKSGSKKSSIFGKIMSPKDNSGRYEDDSLNETSGSTKNRSGKTISIGTSRSYSRKKRYASRSTPECAW